MVSSQLDLEDMRHLVSRMWMLHQQELLTFNRIHAYASGRLGYPSLPEGADQEVKDIARLSIKNVLGMVRDSFAQNLSVVGYRTATSKENLPAWAQWQRNRMDARQAEIYRPALSYGVSYVAITPGKEGPIFRPRSPRQLIAVYADPQIDQWPQYALETWVDTTEARPTRKGIFFDDTWAYRLNLGPVMSALTSSDAERVNNLFPLSVLDEDFAPVRHKVDYCPVVRYINGHDADDMIVGEIEPLITAQRAINEVNFDRLIVARFGAFPQKVIAGWSGSKNEVLEASARRVWAFEDPDVKTSALPAASVEPYNALLEEMMGHVALTAQISPATVTGKMVNVSADALAAAEAQQQRKLQSKRDSFGEAHEQMLKCAAEMAGDKGTAADNEAEIQWRDTEARTFGAVVDGVVKLAASGIPIENLLTMVPGMTQQQIVGIEQALQRLKSEAMLQQLQQGAQDQGGYGSGYSDPTQQPGVPGAQGYDTYDQGGAA